MNRIIVNNIDISECEYYFTVSGKPLCGMDSEYHEDCKERPNCYYKQLKRKEEEYEELKKNINNKKEKNNE